MHGTKHIALGAALSAGLLGLVGSQAQASSGHILLSAPPASITSGSSLTLKGVVQGEDGEPLAGVPVLLAADVGDAVLWQKPAYTGKTGAFSVSAKLARPTQLVLLAPSSRNGLEVQPELVPFVAVTHAVKLALGKTVDGLATVTVKTADCFAPGIELQVRYPGEPDFSGAGEQLECNGQGVMTGRLSPQPGASYRVERVDETSGLRTHSNVVKAAAPKRS